MIIFITGFTTAGKTSIGKELSELLQIPFYDLDDLIEEALAESIASFLAKQEEILFRMEEERVLNKFIAQTKHDCILALGGGTMAFNRNSEVIIQSGICIYIKREIDYFYKNVEYLIENRPLFKELSPSEAKIKIYELLSSRSKFYNKSQLQTLATSGFSPKKLANILKLLTNRPQSL